jgi:DNA-binding transcriptional LysR family regulator
MLDKLRQIAIFAKTVDHGSFRGAAQELRLSPSVVSHHISQLEEHLGCALLYRSTRKIALTPEGEQFLASAHQMIEAAEKGLEEVSNNSSNPSGILRITAPSVLSTSHFMDLVAKFAKNYPGVELSIDFTDMRKELIAGGFDIAIRMGVRPELTGSSRKLFSVPRRLIASPEYVLEQGEPNTPNDLASWEWLELSPVRHIKPTFYKDGEEPIILRPDARLNANDARALYQLARAGCGLAMVPEFISQPGVETGELTYVLPDWQLDMIDVYAMWPSNAPRHGLVRLFIDAISQK